MGFALARSGAVGKKCHSWFNSLGHYHISVRETPHPVSLVEILSVSARSIPSEIVHSLHAISIGHPIVGDNLFTRHEKYYNPVIRYPNYHPSPIIQSWIDPNGSFADIGNITSKLQDFNGVNSNMTSRLANMEVSADGDMGFPGETTTCQWADHPESVTVRRDRGKCRV